MRRARSYSLFRRQVVALACAAEVAVSPMVIARGQCCGEVAAAPVVATYRLQYQTVYDERQVNASLVSYETV